MNKTERRLREDGYRYTGIYETNKEKLKERAEELRAKGFLVRTVDYSLYAKYKALKPAEVEKAKESYKTSQLALVFLKRSLEEMEQQKKELEKKINEENRKIWKEREEVEQLLYKLKDSGVPAEQIAESVN